MKRIITHSKPDADAIAAAWLAETVLFPGDEVEVVFVPRPRPGRPAPHADCVVDIACVHDPERLFFDHKPPAFDDRNATCATRLVWEHVRSLGRPVAHLEALDHVVHEGDRSPPGKPSPSWPGVGPRGSTFRLDLCLARFSVTGGKPTEPRAPRHALEELLENYPFIRLFTAAALFTRWPLARMILDADRDYLFAVNDNQPDLLEAI